jgi:CRISPR-associated endonuclease/helicase Cas3
VTHLQDTARRAREFASVFGGGELAYLLGLWHDVGKFDPAWQEYLLESEAWYLQGRAGPRPKGPDHKAAGVHVAARAGLLPCAFGVQGHHGGMPSKAEIQAMMASAAQRPAIDECIRLANAAIPDLLPSTLPAPPPFVKDARTAEVFIRMLFSALVDADYLDTEEHFHAEQSALREPRVRLSELWERLEDDERRQVPFREKTTVNDVRREVRTACLEAAAHAPGFFRLTVPTGGGKTRSGMAFALSHALKHGLRRVVVAVPFLTIAEQTSAVLSATFDSPVPDDVLREYEGALGREAVLQDYSSADMDDADYRLKLAAENWDAPVIVTTTVQLFESLFSNRPSACRKLHRLARSVIILDEAQALPPQLLEPILDMLRVLVRDYGCTVVFSTATQPAFESIPSFADLRAREIVPDFERHFVALRRVRYEATPEPLSWGAVAGRMLKSPQAMAVVNTRRHAAELFSELAGRALIGTVFHLSTRMTQAHRFRVLDEVRTRLRDGAPCYLVSTQVVEAGIDIDFPLVLRAIAPLDSIIQAAGRCNREGRLGREGGLVVFFEPEDGTMPAGPYRTGADTVRGLITNHDLAEIETLDLYWRRYLPNLALDPRRIQESRAALDYPKVAGDFRMIEPTASIVVTSEDPGGEAGRLLGMLSQGLVGRGAIRQLQRFIVSVPHREFERFTRAGTVRPVTAVLGEWLGSYGPSGIAVD